MSSNPCRLTILLLAVLFLFSVVAFGTFLLTNDAILTIDGKTLKTGIFRGLLHDGTGLYYITPDGIFSVDGRVRIDIKGLLRLDQVMSLLETGFIKSKLEKLLF